MVKIIVMSSVVGLHVEETVACIPARNWVAHLCLLASDYVTLGTLQDSQLVLDLGQSESIRHLTDSTDRNILETSQYPRRRRKKKIIIIINYV